jgi:hypothetical protein
MSSIGANKRAALKAGHPGHHRFFGGYTRFVVHPAGHSSPLQFVQERGRRME